MSSFQELEVHNNSEAQRSYTHDGLNYKTEREHAGNSFGLLPQGYCECEKDTPKSWKDNI